MRRIMRDAKDGTLIEDLWVSPSTTRRRKERALGKKMDVDVVVELCAVDEVPVEDEEKPLEGKTATAFRAVSARINFLSVDRPDIQYCSKEASRCMANPTVGDWQKLKRIGRDLIYRGRVAHMYRWEEMPTTFTVYVDSNWAGCLRTMRSTAGMALIIGDCLIRTLSKTQNNIALSSAEAELYAMVHGASEGLGAQAMARDFGLQVRPHLWVDASAAIGIAQRKGLGTIRHLATQSLWIQDALREKRVSLSKVAGVENPSDMMTKPLEAPQLEKLMALVGLVALEGRPAKAPLLVRGQG